MFGNSLSKKLWIQILMFLDQAISCLPWLSQAISQRGLSRRVTNRNMSPRGPILSFLDQANNRLPRLPLLIISRWRMSPNGSIMSLKDQTNKHLPCGVDYPWESSANMGRTNNLNSIIDRS